MSETHDRVVEQVEFIDKHGKKRIKYKVTFKRSPETEARIEELRLGSFSKEAITKDPDALPIIKSNLAVIQTPYPIARILISSRLHLDKTPHKVMTTSEVLAAYLDQGKESMGSRSLLEGYPQFSQVYVIIRFNDANNKYIGSLVNQLMGLRFHLDKHMWFLYDRDLTTMSTKWPGLIDLSSYPQFKINSLDDVDMEIIKSPSIVDPLPKSNILEDSTLEVEDTSPKDINSDLKFKSKRKKRGR